uniref:Pyrroline-5-carboxylate reductase n=1 Tax=Lygus hesperus TaxID=30085 RepID=A0A146KRB4_LYGHE
MSSTKISYKVGFIGAGNMAKAIGNGILVSETIKAEDIIISAPSDRNLAFWKEKGVRTTHDNAEVITFADIVFIAVKPQYFAGMIEGLKTTKLSVSKPMCFVSIMVGRTVKSVKEVLETVKGISGPFEVIKVMPNTPSMVGTGCSVMVSDKSSVFSSVVRQIMELTGVCEEIPESLMNACGALSGSGPAYLYMVIEALADGGVKLGIPRDLSYRLAAQTMSGAGKMVMESGKHPGVLKDEVCSPGGSTITGVHELEKSGLRAAFMNAITAAAERSEQLGK